MALSRSKDNAQRTYVLEVADATMRLLVLEQRDPTGPTNVRTRTLVWRRESKSPHSPVGIEELTTGFRRLASEEKLAGSKLRVTLGGDFCVTRVVNGTAEKVRRELSLLEDRGQRYLSLGPGRKAIAGSIRQLDARHQHALLTVANQRTLEALLDAGASVGVQFELIEPACVSLARLVGKMGLDGEEPIIVLKVEERGMELGISFEGQLLLDYRPSGRAIHRQIADIVGTHLVRLQRYCARYFNFTKGKLSQVVVCGRSELVDEAVATFENQTSLKATALDPTAACADWRFLDTTPSADLAAAIGIGILPPGDVAPTGPNLMEDLTCQLHQPIVRKLIGALWPIAAALLIGLTVGALAYSEKTTCDNLEVSMASLDGSRGELLKVRRGLVDIEAHEKQFDMIAARVAMPDWQAVVELVSRCLPRGTWLEKLSIDGEGKMMISGTSVSDAGIYEFVNWLKQAPSLTDVALAGTFPTRFQGGSASRFEVECRMRNWVGDNDD